MFNQSNPIDILRSYFGYDSFRFNQLDIINSILKGNDTLAILPTGGGKSICYQIPALIFEGTTIVVSPLISLMKDQVDALSTRKIPATFINSTLSEYELKKRQNGIVSGDYKLVYIAPERIESSGFLDVLEKSLISFIAIDESHCISEWGHDFRPSYRKITKLFERISRKTMAAFTATATPEVRKDIIQSLEMKSPNVFVGGFERPNISISVTYPNNRKKAIIDILSRQNNEPTIIYVGTRKATHELSDFLKNQGYSSSPYHGAMENEERKQIQEKFIKGESQIIVATNAFGMGIDKSDIHCVIHAYLPLTLEAYYQEIGRAGRDGKPSKAILIYSPEDETLSNYFISNLFPDHNDINKLFNFLSLSIKKEGTTFIKGDLESFARRLNISQSNLTILVKYLERKEIIKYYDNSSIYEINLTEINESTSKIINFLEQDRLMVYNKLVDLSEENLKLSLTIDLKYLLNELDITQEQLLTHLNSLQNNSLLQINKKIHLSGIKVINDSFSESIFIETLAEMQKRKDLQTKKYLTFLEFLKTPNCKSAFILDYFGESNTKNCSICDSCLHNLDKNIIVKEFKTKYIPERKPSDREFKLYMNINQLFTENLSFDEFVDKSKMTPPEIANICQKGIELGYISIRPSFIEKNIYNEIVKILSKKPTARLSEIRMKIDSEVSYPLLRIYTAFARLDLN